MKSFHLALPKASLFVRSCLLLTITLAYLARQSVWPAEILVRLVQTGPDPQVITVNAGDTVTWVNPSAQGFLSEGYFGEWSLCSSTQHERVGYIFNRPGLVVYQTFY